MAAAPSPAASTSPLPPEVSLAPPQPLPPDHPATSPSAQPNASPPLGGASLTPPPPPQSVSPQRQSSSPVNGLPPPVSDTPPPPPSPPPPQNSPSATPGLPSPLPPPLSDPPTSSPPTTPSISYPPQSSAPPSSSPPPQSDPQVSSPLSSSSPPSSGSPENPMRPVPPAAASSPPNNSLPIPAAVPPRSSPPKRSPNAPGNSSPPASSTTPSSPSHGGSKTALAVAIAVGAGLAVLCFMLVLLLLRKRQNKKQKKIAPGLNGGYVIPAPLDFTPRTDSPVTKPNSAAPLIGSSSSSDFIHVPPQPGGLWNSRSWFTYDELYKATDGFSAGNLLGEGGFGPVYKGYLPDGQVVAVKQLKVGGGQGEREFKAEVEIITRIHHRHLVSLVGYCVSENRRLLAYDYVPNNTLHFHLHEADNPVMDWATRIKVAAGAARGLAYLHEDCFPRVIHRDIKSSNILLDCNFEARVSDFGLAKLALDANTHVSTRVMGTFGYMAPEYASSGKLTEKSDVFSFGVVLLELITGRKPVDPSQSLGDESLVEWARPLLNSALNNETVQDVADPRLESNYIENEMICMIQAATACVRHSAARRPRMGQIVRAFDGIADSDLTNGMRLGESEIYYPALQSAEIKWFERMAFGNQEHSSVSLSQGSSGRANDH